MFATIQGNFVGLGVELKAGQDCLQILSVIPGGPADESGLIPGDRILEVAGTSAAETDPDTVADLLRGEEGSVVTLVLADPVDRVRTLRVAGGGSRSRAWRTCKLSTRPPASVTSG